MNLGGGGLGGGFFFTECGKSLRDFDCFKDSILANLDWFLRKQKMTNDLLENMLEIFNLQFVYFWWWGSRTVWYFWC